MLRLTDDLVLLSQLVEAGSFTAASRITGITKSRLSRRLAELESRLGLRLIERTSRSFRVTEIGQQLAHHGLSIRSEGDAALALAQNTLAEPSGPLSVACPSVLSELIVGKVAADFAVLYPQVQLTFDVISGLPDDVPDCYDLFFRASPSGLPDTDMVARQLLLTRYELVATPEWIAAAGNPRTPQALDGLDGVGWWQVGSTPRWRLFSEGGGESQIIIKPRFHTNNLAVARLAALAGLGMTRLPRPICYADICSNRLCRVLADHAPDPMGVYVVYPTRQSLTPAGRLFLEQIESSLADFARDTLFPENPVP